MDTQEYRDHIDSLSYSDPEWLAIIKWNNEQVDLCRASKRAPGAGERLVDVYYDEVVSRREV